MSTGIVTNNTNALNVSSGKSNVLLATRLTCARLTATRTSASLATVTIKGSLIKKLFLNEAAQR